jgi:hypothetical protein
MDLTGGFKKTIILSVEPKLYSDLKVIASSEQKTIEDMLQDWIQHLVETRGNTQYINAQDLAQARQEIAGDPQVSASQASQNRVGVGDSTKESKTRFIRNPNQPISVAGGDAEETVVFFCRFCFQKCRVPKQYLGKRVECPRCRNALEVPTPK